MVPTEPHAFGDLLRRHRVLGGLSQEDLAEKAGLSARAISDLERGVKRTPRRDTIQLLVDALHLSQEDRSAFVTAAREPATRSSAKPAADRAIAGGDAAPAIAMPIGGFLGAVAERPLVGREAEAAAVLAALKAVREDSGRLLVLAGEPGVGKTRLAQEAALACRDRGFLVATGRCYEPHQAVPYYPFLEALSALHAAAPAPVRAEVGARWPALLRLLPDQPPALLPAVAAGTGASPQEEQQRLFWAVTGFLQAVSEIVPLAFLLDDLHWADDASLALLQHLARHTRAHRVLLLGTHRDVAVGRRHPLWRAWRDLEREHLVERLAVRRLGRDGTTRLIADRLGQDVSDDCAGLLHLVYRHTDGHPLFVREVLQALIERGDVYRRDGRWECKEITALEVPESVRATIADRASRLSERAQEALRAASVLGQAFAFEDLQATGGLSEDELEAALEEAVAAGLLDESRDGYAFNHALTQQALYTELPARHRKRLHLAAADALERLPESIRRRRAAELAGHFREGGAPARALPYALLAGDQAAAVYAPAEAEQQYRLAAELARTLDDPCGEAQAREKLGWLLWMMARFDACAEALERAARQYRGAGDVDGEVRVAALLGMLHFTARPREGAARIRALLDRLGTPQPSRPLAALYASLAMNLLIAGRYGAALEAATSAGATARALGDGDERPRAVEAMRAPALGLSGHLADARRLLAEWIPVAEADGDYFGLLSAVHYLGDLSVPAGDFGAAWDAYSRALELTERLGARSRLGAETANLAEVLFYRGDWEQARQYAGRAVDLTRAAAAGRTVPYFQDANVLRRLGMIRAARGEWEEAIPFLEESVALAERLPYPEAVRSGQAALAEQEILQGQPDRALARLEPLVEQSDPAELGIVSLLPLLAGASLELGDAERAAAVVREGIERAMRQGHTLALVELPRVRGMALARQSRREEAERAFAEAVAVARALPYPYAEGRALYEWGLLATGMGDTRQARARLEEAAAIFERLGARPYAERARQALAPLAHRRHVGAVDADGQQTTSAHQAGGGPACRPEGAVERAETPLSMITHAPSLTCDEW